MSRGKQGNGKNQDGAFKFEAFSNKQLKLLNWWRKGSPYSEYGICIADGAIRSGKTIAMIASFLQFAMEEFEGCDFIIAGRSVGALKRNVINPLKRILNAWGWEYLYNRSENYIKIDTNTFYLFGANNEASQDTIQGMTAAGALADEAALYPRSFVDQMIGRCSIEGSKIFMNCNPAGPFHYMKTEYIDKAKEKEIYHIHFVMDDNLTLSEEIKDRYRRQFSGVFYLRYIQGLWQQAEGIIYSMFNDSMLFDDGDIPEKLLSDGQRYIAVDYGTTNPCVFLDIYDDGMTSWVIREYYWDSRDKDHYQAQKTDQEYVEDLEEFIKGKEPQRIIIDPSAESFRVALRKRGHRVREADNTVLDGIRRVSSAFILGILKVHKNCKRFREELGVYSWDEKKAQIGKEEPVKVKDHACDACRYYANDIISDKRLMMASASRKNKGESG